MTVEIEGVTLHLAHPDELTIQWVGQEELMRQLLAAWMVVHEQDVPMNPRLLGKPGVGKTTLAYAGGKRMGRDVYILQATLDTRPEDLLVVYDEMDLPVGRLRLRGDGSAAGHNGIDNIIRHLHTNRFPRLRVGVGAEAARCRERGQDPFGLHDGRMYFLWATADSPPERPVP